MDTTKLVSRKALARELDVETQTIAHWGRAGWFPAPKIRLSLKQGPLVRLAFTRYATGKYTFRKPCSLLADLGLRNRCGGPIGLSGLSYILRNPFYIGNLEVKATGELLPGHHMPLVERKLFFDVQARLKTRIWPRRLTHRFKYSWMLRCRTCGRCLVGSETKGRCTTGARR
jgi:hypothetical protein